MKRLIKINCYLLLLTCLFSSLTIAQHHDSYFFKIIDGNVTIITPFCTPDFYNSANLSRANLCHSAKLSGTFVSVLRDGDRQLFFSESNVITIPAISFQLPWNPNQDSDGIRGQAQFTFDGNLLKVDGFINPLANKNIADAPVIKYSFVAKVDEHTSNKINLFTIRPDLFLCSEPLCGGYFVKAVNNKLTRCADGTQQQECYVAELYFPGGANPVPDFPSQTTFFAAGQIVAKKFKGFGNLGTFKAYSLQQSASSQPAVVNQFYLPVPVKDHLFNCELGYSYQNNACRTPYGCKYPKIELTGYGSVALVDLVTGEVSNEISKISKSCTKNCDSPAILQEPGQCAIYFP